MCPVFALLLPLFFPGNLPNVDHFGPLYTQRPIKYFTNQQWAQVQKLAHVAEKG